MLAYKACPESRNWVIGFPTYWCASIDGTCQLISSWYRNSIIQFRYVFLATYSLCKLRYDLLPRALIIDDWFVGKGMPLLNDVPTMLNLDIIWRWSPSCLGHFAPLERARCTYCTGGWLGSRTSLDMVVKSTISAPAGNQTPILWSSSQWLIWGYLIRFFNCMSYTVLFVGLLWTIN
jgi:hypothetical protein